MICDATSHAAVVLDLIGFELFTVEGFFFFFNDTATTEIYTLSLHDALPISHRQRGAARGKYHSLLHRLASVGDRKSTRLNSSHGSMSYAVFCWNKETRL